MPSTADVRSLVLAAIEDFNRQQPRDKRLTPESGAILLGEGGVLDSLGVINLLVAVEEAVTQRYTMQIDLLNQATEANAGEVFGTVGHLIGFIEQRTA